jgi:hypothetical protein
MTFARSQNCGLDKWRYDDGSPRQTDNVYRCPHHNDSLGGVKQSRHMYRDAADLQSVKENEAEYNAMHAAATRANAHHIEPLADSCGLECIHADRRDYTGAYSTATRGPSAGDQVQLRPAIVKELSSSDQRVRKCAFYRLLGASGNQSRADLRDLRMVNLPVGVIETNAMASQGQTALGTIAVPRGAALLDDACGYRKVETSTRHSNFEAGTHVSVLAIGLPMLLRRRPKAVTQRKTEVLNERVAPPAVARPAPGVGYAAMRS